MRSSGLKYTYYEILRHEKLKKKYKLGVLLEIVHRSIIVKSFSRKTCTLSEG